MWNAPAADALDFSISVREAAVKMEEEALTWTDTLSMGLLAAGSASRIGMESLQFLVPVPLSGTT